MNDTVYYLLNYEIGGFIFILLFSFIDYDTRLKAANTFAICERLLKVTSYENVHTHINFDLVLARMLFVFVA